MADTWPIPVADGWAGADMRVFPLLTCAEGPTDRQTDQLTDRQGCVSATEKWLKNVILVFCLYLQVHFGEGFGDAEMLKFEMQTGNVMYH